MKKLLFSFCFALLGFIVKSQPGVSPGVTAEICPEVNVALQFSFGGGIPSNYSIQTVPINGCTIISNIDGQGRAVVKFTDKKETHQFRVWNSAVQAVVGTYTYTKIKTIDAIKPTWPPSTPGIYPSPPFDDVLNNIPPAFACTTVTFNYTVPSLKYKDSGGTEYGTAMTFYQWLVPKGWQVNGNTSDGVTPIDVSSPTASITSDPISTGELQCRARNNCDPNNLKKSNWYRILINRQGLRLSVNGVSPLTISCGDQSNKTFSLENINLYSCVTSYEWQIGANWLLPNGQQAPSTLVTSTSSLTLKLPGTSAVPGAVSVKVLINGVANSNIFTCPVNFVDVTAAPTFSPNNNYTVCSASTQSFSILGGCSPVNYTYTLSNTGPVFSANGLTTLITTSSTVNIDFPSGNSYTTLLSAHANYPNNVTSTEINRQIQFGNAPLIAGYYSNSVWVDLIDEIAGSNYLNSNTWTVIHASTPVNSTPQQWTSVGGFGYSWQIDAYNELNLNIQPGGYAAFQMDINGDCSGISNVYIFEPNGGYRYYSVSPNPAMTDITVYLDEEKLKKLRNQKTDDLYIRQVIIRDKFGNTVLQKKMSGQTRKATLNVSSLSTGIYVIEIFDGKTWSSLKLMKN